MTTLLKTVALNVFKDLFEDNEQHISPSGQIYKRQVHSNGIRSFCVNNFTFIEQNPNKPTHFGRLAKEGTQIMWVVPPKSTRWSKVVDGEWYE